MTEEMHERRATFVRPIFGHEEIAYALRGAEREFEMAADRPTRSPPPQRELGASEAFALLNFAQTHGISAEEALAIRQAAGDDDEKAEHMAGDLKGKRGKGTAPA